MLDRSKATVHPWIDPWLSLPDRWRAQRQLMDLPDGEYHAPVSVPYCAQFASPDRIYDYIHHEYDGRQDPNWQVFGVNDPAEYAFWAPRVCALACLKMAIEAFYPSRHPTLWQLVKEGLEVGGYTVRDLRGRWLDHGWTYPAQVHLARRYGLQAEGQAYISAMRVCQYIREGWLVVAAVTPDIGERQPGRTRYGGHMVLVHGFRWENRRPACYYLHNPSGRFPELQAHAQIPAERFEACFAHRVIMLRPAG